MASLLIRNGMVLPCQETIRKVYHPGFVFISGERITEVGPGDPPEGLLSQADEIIDASGCAVVPGFINAHTHGFQTFLRGLADDKPLLEWLKAATWPGALAMTEQDFYLSGLLSFVENLKTGSTSVLSQDYIQTSPANMDCVAQAAQESGVRALISRGFADRDPYYPAFQEKPETIIRETERLVRAWNGRDGGRVRFEFGPLIPWGCQGSTLQAIDRCAKDWGIGVQIHLDEAYPEVLMTLEETGLRPAAWLESLGVLNERWTLVHCVWLDDHEMDLIAKGGSTIVHCPVSNMYLASGIPKVTEWRKRGIPTALATDGPGSNNSQDILEVLKFTACLQKVGAGDAMALLPEDVLDMLYRGGARAVGLEDQVGQLKPGFLADITLVDLRRAHISPVHSPISALVYNANGSDVHTVIVNGEVLVRDHKLTRFDEDKLIADCQQAAEALCARAGIHTLLH